jgi:hypothetical protein
MASSDRGKQPEASESGLTAKDAFDHAWSWFSYHAEQRMTIVRFTITIVGGIAAAFGYFWKEQVYWLCAMLSLSGIIAALCALRIDLRTADLVKIGEDALKPLESALADLVNSPFMNICMLAEDKTKNPKNGRKKKLYSYRQNFILIYGIVIFIFIISLIISITAVAKPNWRIIA